MQKNKLLVLPFLAGLLLIFCSWYLSFPLSQSSSADSIFSHISILYWLGFPLLLTSMCLIAITFENKYLKWIMTVGCVILFYSLLFFYNTLPTSDANYFRGLTENFVIKKNLNPQVNNYYQWPAYFILADVTSTVSGLELVAYEFLLLTILGFLLSTALYVYASKINNRGGIFAVLAFFILSFSFLNYQAAPFTVALCLLFLLFGLETQRRNASIVLTMIILYIGLTLTHFFVPLFFIAYLLIQLVISRSRKNFSFLVLLLAIYFLVQINFAELSFAVHLVQVFVFESDYSNLVAMTLSPVVGQIDIIAQLFSRTVTLSFALLCFTGFVFLATKRKLRDVDKAIFLTGIVFSGAGVVLYTLGTRTIPLIFVPLSIGILYLLTSRFRSYLKYLVIILLILVVFIPLHSQYTGYPITFQTKENIATADFLVEKYDWNSSSIFISDVGMKWYLAPMVDGYSRIDSDYTSRFGLTNITNYDCIIYSFGLERSLQLSNISIEATSRQISDKYSIVYNSAFSYVAIKNK
jgi:hypothetical protein